MPENMSQVERVLFVAPEMAARGTNEYTVNMAAELRERGVEALVFCGPGPMLNLLRARGIKWETFEGFSRAKLRRGERDRLVQRLGEFSPQVVHALTVQLASMLANMPEAVRVPIVLTVHGHPAKPRAFRSATARVSGVIATSQDVREGLVNKCRVEKDRIVFIPNGVDVVSLTRKAIRPIFTGKVPVVGSVGPVETARGHELFVRAASRLTSIGRVMHFVVAGEGRQLPGLRKLSRELGIDGSLTFVSDFWAYEDVLDALDIVVQSSQVDVSGFSILDAMAHGRPVIAFNTGTACEIVEDGRTGLLIPRENIQLLAEAITRLVEDRQLAVQMGAAARDRVAERFDIRHVADMTLQYYHRLLSG